MGVNEHRQGFTLLELMIVFAILGLLATIAMTSLASRVGDYRFTQAMDIIGRVDAHARRQASTQRQTVRTSVASLTNVLRVGTPEGPMTRSFKLPSGITDQGKPNFGSREFQPLILTFATTHTESLPPMQ